MNTSKARGTPVPPFTPREDSSIDHANADNVFNHWDDDDREWPTDDERGIVPEHDEPTEEEEIDALVESWPEGNSRMSANTRLLLTRSTRRELKEHRSASSTRDPRPGTPGRGQGEGRARASIVQVRQARTKRKIGRAHV